MPRTPLPLRQHDCFFFTGLRKAVDPLPRAQPQVSKAKAAFRPTKGLVVALAMEVSQLHLRGEG
jgi:hypothetical protein